MSVTVTTGERLRQAWRDLVADPIEPGAVLLGAALCCVGLATGWVAVPDLIWGYLLHAILMTGFVAVRLDRRSKAALSHADPLRDPAIEAAARKRYSDNAFGCVFGLLVACGLYLSMIWNSIPLSSVNGWVMLAVVAQVGISEARTTRRQIREDVRLGSSLYLGHIFVPVQLRAWVMFGGAALIESTRSPERGDGASPLAAVDPLWHGVALVMLWCAVDLVNIALEPALRYSGFDWDSRGSVGGATHRMTAREGHRDGRGRSRLSDRRDR